MNENLSFDEKIKILGLDEAKTLFPQCAIDYLYTKHINGNKSIDKIIIDNTLYLLNELLTSCNYDKIKKITEFRMIRSDLMKIDGEEFYEKYKDKFDEMNIDKHIHLHYYNRKIVQCYLITIIKGIIKNAGYELYGFSAKLKHNDIITDAHIYKIREISKK